MEINLLQEVAKGLAANRAKIQDLMTKTFMGRRKWVINDLPVIRDILIRFPPLQNKSIVSTIIQYSSLL